MPRLPDGYDRTPPAVEILGVTIPGEQLYGGADPSDHYDATGAHWFFCDAKGPDGIFKFRAFRAEKGSDVYTEQPLPDFASGRGNADVQFYDGRTWYTAWEGNSFEQDVVPGFARFPAASEIETWVAQLEQRIAALEARAPVGDSGALEGIRRALRTWLLGE